MISWSTPSLRYWSRLLVVLAVLGLLVATAYADAARKIGEFTFYDSELSMVLKALSDIGGINIVVAPDVKGKVTITLKDVTTEEALTIITKMANLSYEKENGTYIVHVASSAPKVAPLDEGYEILELKSANIAAIKSAVGIAYKDLVLQELPNRRLVLVGAKARLRDAKEFISKIDYREETPVETPVEMLESTYKVKTLVPWQAKKYLEDQYSNSGLTVLYAPTRAWQASGTGAGAGQNPTSTGGAGVTGNEGVTGAKIGPAPVIAQNWQSDELILRGPKLVVEKALVTLTRLDADVPLVDKRCTVKRIYASQAIAYLLERFESSGLSIFTAPMNYVQVVSKTGENTGVAAKGGQIGALVHRDKDGLLNVAEPIGDFIISGPEDVVKNALAALEAIDIGPERVEHIVSVRFLSIVEAQKQLDKMYAGDGLQVTVAPTRRSTTPDVVKNSADAPTKTTDATADYTDVFDLVLRGPEIVVNKAEALLKRLDTEPSQISIGTEIITINTSETNNLGIQWGGVANGVLTPGSAGVNLNEVQSGDPLRLGSIIRSPVSLNATLNMLQSRNRAKVINRPTTVVENGRKALIHVGDIISYESLAGYGTNGPQYTTNLLSTGVTVQVRPIQSSDGLITLEITTNITDPPTFRKSISGSELPSYRENANTTVVKVHDGETLVIGGLRQAREEVTRDEVPVLGRIPLIGGFFRNKKTAPSQSELLMLVTPTVLKSPAVATATGTAATP